MLMPECWFLWRYEHILVIVYLKTKDIPFNTRMQTKMQSRNFVGKVFICFQ